ncbi:MAG: hypothetical protein A2288_00795 [Candidatus Moranbacteria bacterium RIFOXYA12_FULL_44_15]|nr:MAG: hypothetical protein A2288_00795 [Candidatus Moranbacteria bacterium RIFOXYA12_FULL_44_15]OGI35065.1 MAG: hypothetical protein A2259_04810 [Candidatus Moranbacteria bacterium RIFOXYA2_FULL_43_15]
METQEILKKRSLFWDVGKLDVEKNARFIMERILNFGDVEDFRWARDIYGSDKLKESLLSSRTLNDRSLLFWCNYFKLDKDQCLKTQSSRKQSAFWKR